MSRHYLLLPLYLTASLLLTSCGNDEEATRIVLGRTNLLHVLNELQYQDPFVVQTTDRNGNAVPYQQLKLSIRNVSYIKGYYQANVDDEWEANQRVECAAEDANNNGVLDAGEDFNGNGTLEPTNPATIGIHPELVPTVDVSTGELVTDDQGFGYFTITYPKSEAKWVRVIVSAKTDVTGTENTATYGTVLSVLDDDLSDISIAPPGGGPSPYGIEADCSNPN